MHALLAIDIALHFKMILSLHKGHCTQPRCTALPSAANLTAEAATAATSRPTSANLTVETLVNLEIFWGDLGWVFWGKSHFGFHYNGNRKYNLFDKTRWK